MSEAKKQYMCSSNFASISGAVNAIATIDAGTASSAVRGESTLPTKPPPPYGDLSRGAFGTGCAGSISLCTASTPEPPACGIAELHAMQQDATTRSVCRVAIRRFIFPRAISARDRAPAPGT